MWKERERESEKKKPKRLKINFQLGKNDAATILSNLMSMRPKRQNMARCNTLSPSKAGLDKRPWAQAQAQPKDRKQFGVQFIRCLK